MNNPRPERATGCPQCMKDPTAFDSEGYSKCCQVFWDVDACGECIPKPPAIGDPTSKRVGRPYRGVTRVVNHKKASTAFRVRISRGSTSYFLGDFDDERTAATVFDNAVYYLHEYGSFFRRGYTPALNFPEHYADVTAVPPRFLAVSKLIRRLKTETIIPK